MQESHDGRNEPNDDEEENHFERFARERGWLPPDPEPDPEPLDPEPRRLVSLSDADTELIAPNS